jgi:tetratricopeptide (TPR) repeat protein
LQRQNGPCSFPSICPESMQSAKHQFVEAANTYRALFSFFPDNREYGRLLIQSLSSAGRSDQALAESQKLLASSNPATARDPLLFSVIADMYSTLGNWPSSLEWAKRGADESKRRGATILYERLLTTESQANLHMGRYAVAEAQTREALTLARQYHDVSGELRALNRLGEIATAQKDWTAAESALLAAVDLEHTYDQSQREAHTLLTLSRLNQSRGDLPKAVAYGTKATDLAKKLGFADLTTEARLQMAVVNGAMGHRASATTQLIEVRAEAEQIHDAYLQQQAQDALNGLKVH